MTKTGTVIMQNTKHIRHTSVTVEHYLRDQFAKARMQTPVHLWGTDPSNYHNESYGPYMQQSNYGGHSVDSSNDNIRAYILGINGIYLKKELYN